MNKIANLLLFLFLMLSVSLRAQKISNTPIGPQNMVSGVLDNGVHYYVFHNEEPKNRASFYFAQNVGSVLEKDSQRGLAHFLEHMAFNGTQHFKGKEMLEYLEKNGMKFGSEINAFTSFDETVYNINQVPVTNEKLLDSVLLILHDWSGYLSLTDAEIDNERGVINEEWRSRYTAGFRANSKVWLDGYLKNSMYGKRMPIGLMDVVNNFEYDELRNYYKRWYRPDLQAVVVVGDVDIKEIESKIKKLFSSIPLKKDLPERPVFDLPITADFVYINSTDKELGEPSLKFFIKRNPLDLSIVEQIKEDVIGSFASYILNNRFSELVLKEDAPVLNAGFGVQHFVRPLEVLNLSARPKKDSLHSALQYIVTQYNRFAEFGATPGEISRTRAAFKTSLESAKANIAKRSNDSYAGEIYQNFFNNEPVTDYAWKLDYQLSLLEKVTNADILSYLSHFEGEKGRGVSIVGSDTNEYPEEKEVVASLADVAAQKLTPFEEKISDIKLINTSLSGSPVVETESVDGIDAQLYTLANGLKLVLYPTDFDKEQIFMKAFSPGGSSLLSVEELPNNFIASYLVDQSGLGDLNKIELKKLLAGTQTSLGVAISGYSENLSGSSKTKDLEILFKKIYLQFMAPRFDAQAFEILKQNLATNLIAKEKSVSSEFKDALQKAASGNSERVILFDQKLIDAISLEGAQKIYRERISNAADFTFVFVGDFEEEKLLEFATKYLGSIPGNAEIETIVNHNIRPVKGKTKVNMTKEMETPQATISVMFNGDMKYSKKNNLKLYVLSQLLDKRYMDRIREEEGGSYGVRVNGSVSWRPVGSYNLNVSFNCNPDKADDLLKIVYEELKKMETSIDVEELSEIKTNYKKRVSESQRKNSYWLNNIANNLQKGMPVSSESSKVTLIESITEKDLMATAEFINNDPAIVEGELMPLE